MWNSSTVRYRRRKDVIRARTGGHHNDELSRLAVAHLWGIAERGCSVSGESLEQFVPGFMAWGLEFPPAFHRPNSVGVGSRRRSFSGVPLGQHRKLKRASSPWQRRSSAVHRPSPADCSTAKEDDCIILLEIQLTMSEGNSGGPGIIILKTWVFDQEFS
ncbi:hypothetical protein RRG08_003590 [Elysia crispata]|uniref:Uncharacterized protein n=1 Tax=Elysia crispata TaxID=231223 RepID=A0AAE1CYZ3_9GAST|nr:hypothetical protein RRG08_003590 [Elysia crispata]